MTTTMEQKQLKEKLLKIQDEIWKLEEEIRIKKLIEKKLEKELDLIGTTHFNIDFFPSEAKKFGMFVPNEFRIYRKDGSKTFGYCLKYGNYKFRIWHRDDEPDPYSLTIRKRTAEIISDPEFEDQAYYDIEFYLNVPDNNDLSLLVRIFYKNPEEIIDAENFHKGELLDFNSIIDRCKYIFDDQWSDELSFGICLYYYWIKMFYQSADYDGLYKVFHPEYYD